MTTDTPAFPISLRDYFAAQAMAAFIAQDTENVYGYEEIATQAYSQADEMMKERALPPGSHFDHPSQGTLPVDPEAPMLKMFPDPRSVFP